MGSRCDVDCDEGRRLGCQTFCCRMVVRLDPSERVPNTDGLPEKSCVDKTEDGYCIHFDRKTNYCAIWQNRPKVCREYDCNSDIMLQAALRTKFRNIVELAKAAYKLTHSKIEHMRIPYCGGEENIPRLQTESANNTGSPPN